MSSWRAWRLGVPSVAAALLLVTAHSSIGAPPIRVEGPFGRGSSQVWLIRPGGSIRSVVVFGHGWKLYPPSAAHPWVGQFRAWLDHLAVQGSAVVFPRYQLGTGDSQGPDRAMDFRRGVALGFERLGRPAVPVIAVGYSYGASLAFSYAADARRWSLSQPSAVDCIFPAGPVGGIALDALPDSVRVLVQVGDRDTEAGRSGADAFWRLLAAHPANRKRYEIINSGNGLVADHAAPKRADAAARRAFWAPLDALVSVVRRTPPHH